MWSSTFYMAHAYLCNFRLNVLILHKLRDYVQNVNYAFGLSSPSWRRFMFAHTHTHKHIHTHSPSFSLPLFVQYKHQSDFQTERIVTIFEINQKDLTQIYVRLAVISLLCLSHFKRNWNLSTDRHKPQTCNISQILPVGVRFSIRTDGQTYWI
jgi:hypothetical protein